MKHSVAVKFLAIILCALSVVSIAACGFGILFMENWNLYNMPLEQLKKQQLESIASDIAWNHAQIQAAQSLSNCPQEILDDALTHSYAVDYIQGHYAVEIYQGIDLVYSMNSAADLGTYHTHEYTIAPNYPIVTYQYTQSEQNESSPMTEVPVESIAPTSPRDESEGNITAPVATEEPRTETIAGTPDAASVEWTKARDTALERVEGQEVIYSIEHTEDFWTEDGSPYWVTYILDYYAGPEYLVKVYLEDSSVLGTEYALMSVLYPYRDSFIPLLLVSLLTFAAALVYLFASAGRIKGGGIAPAGLNKIPLDLYAAGAGLGIFFLVWLLVVLLDNYSTGYYGIWDNIPLCMLIIGMGLFSIALLAIGFLFAFAAQIKVKGGYWWRHSVCGFLLQQIVIFLRWVRRGLRYFYRGCRAVVRLLPIIWQWLATAAAMVVVPVILFLLGQVSYGLGEAFWSLLCVLSVFADIALVCYGAWCFGLLLKSVKIMAQGNLNYQVNTKYLFGCFKDFAIHLNSLAGAAQVAAERQMKSERMKTELITNVSHDIKTPLTSIINYVDLMKKPHSNAEDAMYLDVLDRQSQRLKKLIDDLMDMSKASSGNVTVEIGQVDAVEAVNQALGEFADKLDRVNLTPVFRHPDFPVTMQADGRLVWRVLSNLLSNAVKYALPDTRLYIDLMVLQGNAVLAIKNISRDQLNMDADELMERFVRGDTSRNTEGSGLGLNIAKSLVELQRGQMHLMVDGDLFKVTLIFPLA